MLRGVVAMTAFDSKQYTPVMIMATLLRCAEQLGSVKVSKDLSGHIHSVSAASNEVVYSNDSQ